MSTVTLLAKIHSDSQLKVVEKFLGLMLKDLNVETKICGITSRGWAQIAVSGEDEKAALRYLDEEVGLCVSRLENVERFSVIKGQIITIDGSRGKVYVDIGIYSPRIIDVSISLQHLQAQLLDGRDFDLSDVVKLFGFCKNLPLGIKIFRIDKESNCVEGLLSENQLSQYKNWTDSLLDRLIILGVSEEEVKLALRRTKCDRDVTEIEPLGLFEYAVVCKLGTDAAGLIPKIGRYLRKATLTIFCPEKVLKLLDYSAAFVF
jgi:hypothetical protein